MAPRWQPGPDFVSQRLDDEVVLINLRTNTMFSLNRTGARVWELLQIGHDWRATREILLEEFDVRPDELDHELETLAASLAAKGFVQQGDTSPPRPSAPKAATASRRGSRVGAPGLGRRPATASLLIRMGAWSLLLPVIKHLLPLPTVVRLMSGQGSAQRSYEKERRIVGSASRVYRHRRPGSCLERSLLAYRYLSTANADPRLVIGVQRDDRDVIGHAWVLVDGSPLYESSAYLDSFVPILTFASDGYATTTVSGRAASPDSFPPPEDED